MSYDAVTRVVRIFLIDFLVRERLESFFVYRGGPTGVEGELNDFGPHGALLGTRAFIIERWLQRLMVATPPVGSSRGLTHKLFPPAVLLWWLGRSFGKESHRLTQIQLGHGCFDVFLHRIYRVSSPICTFCGVPRRDMASSKDSVAHTLVECTVFDGKRAALVR